MLSQCVLGRRDAFYRSCATQTVLDPQSQVEFSFLEDEVVHIESSRKVILRRPITMTSRRENADWMQYSEGDTYRLFSDANLRPLRRWKDPDSGYCLWLLERPPFNFKLPRSPATTISNTPFGIPTLQEFQESWAAWDFITRKMLPDSMLFEKPIDLRHICLFYIGHIPTFLDIHLSNLLGEPNTEPEYFKVRLVLIFPL